MPDIFGKENIVDMSDFWQHLVSFSYGVLSVNRVRLYYRYVKAFWPGVWEISKYSTCPGASKLQKCTCLSKNATCPNNLKKNLIREQEIQYQTFYTCIVKTKQELCLYPTHYQSTNIVMMLEDLEQFFSSKSICSAFHNLFLIKILLAHRQVSKEKSLAWH